MSARVVATRIGDGVYRVDVDGRTEIVHVAGEQGQRWVHWNGQVFERPFAVVPRTRSARQPEGAQALSAPMPSTVRKVAVAPGTRVSKGDTLLVLEAMKMELPIRAAADGVVRAVHCREGELVQPGVTLIELDQRS